MNRWAAVIVLLSLAGSTLAADEPRIIGRTRQDLVRELESGSRRQRVHAAWALSQLAVQQAGPDDTMVWLNELYLLVESDSSSVRYWGLVGLGQFLSKLDRNHPARATAVKVLTEALADRSLAARVAAAESLALAGQPRDALPVLIDAMKSPQESVRIQAVSALERLGSSAAPARATLQAAAEDASEYVKRISTRALQRLE
jgi:HEAT repeat protein